MNCQMCEKMVVWIVEKFPWWSEVISERVIGLDSARHRNARKGPLTRVVRMRWSVLVVIGGW